MNVTHPIDGGLPSWLIASTTMPFRSTSMSVRPRPVLASILAILPDWLRSVLAAIAPDILTVCRVGSLVLQSIQMAATHTRARPEPDSCPTNSRPTPDEAAQTTSLLGRLPIWRRIKVGAIGVIAQYGVRRDGVGSARDTVDTAPSEVGPVGTEHGPFAEFALGAAREWIRVGGPLAEFRTWRSGVPWERLTPDDQREILDAAVKDRFATDADPSSVIDTLSYWLGTVAPLIYDDPVERLEWFAALWPAYRPHQMPDTRLREVIQAIDLWTEAIDHEDDYAVRRARRALAGIAATNMYPTAGSDRSVASAWDNHDQSCGWSAPPPASNASPLETHSAGWVTAPTHGPTVVAAVSRISGAPPDHDATEWWDEETGDLLRWLQHVDTQAAANLVYSDAIYEAAAERVRTRLDDVASRSCELTLLDVGVRELCGSLGARNSPRARLFTQFVVATAQRVHHDPVDRLEWLARTVASPIHALGLNASPVRDMFADHVREWFAEVPAAPIYRAANVILTWWNSSMEVCVDEAQLQVCTDELRRRMAVADAPSKPRSPVREIPKVRPTRATSKGWGFALLRRVRCAVAELGRWATDRVPLGRSAPVLALNAGARGP